MKHAKKLLTSLVLILMLTIVAVGVRPIRAQAATKTVKNIKYSTTLTKKISKYATTVKKGTTTLKVTKQGYLRFVAPSTKTYTFTLSKMTNKVDNGYNCGHGYIMSIINKTSFNHLTFKTTGGKTTSMHFATKSGTQRTTGSYLATRSCKLKLKKGQTIYVYLYFVDKGNIKLNIK